MGWEVATKMCTFCQTVLLIPALFRTVCMFGAQLFSPGQLCMSFAVGLIQCRVD